MAVQSTQAAAVSRLFSASVFQELAVKGRSPMFARLANEIELSGPADDFLTIGDYFDLAFKWIKRTQVRNEYVYRTAIVKNILTGKHSLNTASMLSEFRAGNSKADIVILNGTATVYEIKSERDTLNRLERQLSDYRRVFANVNVIAGEHHIQFLMEQVQPEIGLLCLRESGSISTVRASQECLEEIDPVFVLESLRVAEAEKVLRILGKEVPTGPNTQIRSMLKSAFEGLPPASLHRAMVAVLKQTRSQSTLKDFILELPVSLRAAALSHKLQKGQRENLLAAMSSPMIEAKTWA